MSDGFKAIREMFGVEDVTVADLPPYAGYKAPCPECSEPIVHTFPASQDGVRYYIRRCAVCSHSWDERVRG